MAGKLTDEIDRLFAELIHDPWQRGVARSRAGQTPVAGHSFEIEVPVEGADGDLSVTVEGDLLTIVVSARAATRSTAGADVELAASRQQTFRRTFSLPPGARLAGVEVASNQERMRVRVRLEK